MPSRSSSAPRPPRCSGLPSAGSATAAGPRTLPRTPSRPSGAPPRATTGLAGGRPCSPRRPERDRRRAPPPARAARRRGARARRARAGPCRRRGAGLPGLRGASIAPSRSSPSRSGRSSSWRTGAASRRAKIAEYLQHPAGNREDAHALSALPPPRRRAGGRARRAEPRDLHDLIGEDVEPDELEAAPARARALGAGGATAGAAAFPSPTHREPPSARVIPFTRRYRYTALAAAAIAAVAPVLAWATSLAGGPDPQARGDAHDAEATAARPQSLRCSRKDEAGNWPMEIGCPSPPHPLPPLRAVADARRRARGAVRCVPGRRRRDDGAAQRPRSS